MLILQIIRDEPTPLRKLDSRIPRDLETISLKCLEKDPARRYTTALELADDLQPLCPLRRGDLWGIRRRAIPRSYALQATYVGVCRSRAHRVRGDLPRGQNQNSDQNVSSSTYVSSRGSS